MTAYDFGVDPVALRSTPSKKWNRYGADVLPAWIADMDFRVAPEIQAAIDDVTASRYYGYPRVNLTSAVAEAFAARAAHRWGAAVDPELVLAVPEAVQCLHAATAAFSDPGDGVLVLTPIYPPFLDVPVQLRRTMVEHRLVDGTFDAAALRATAARERPRVLLLCNPHNPIGRVFTEAELRVLAEIVVEHDMVCVADEIHADLVFAPHRHVPFTTMGRDVAARTVTVTSASKAFNLAGLRCAVMAYGSAALRERFQARLPEAVLGVPSTVGLAACAAAWRDAQPWLDACMTRLAENRAWLNTTLASRLPEVGYTEPEATFLAWLDFSDAVGTAAPVEACVAARLLGEARVALNEGPTFGSGLDAFARLNFATSPDVLAEIVGRIEHWVGERTSRRVVA